MSNKTSDKNVGSIEEDIKILENLKSYLNLLVYEGKDKIIYNDLLWDEKTVDCINAIENILQDYTRQKQINEEHQKTNGELKKVKELEEYIFVAPNLDEMTATKYLAIQRESYVKGRAEEQQKAKQIIYENYIPKQKIKDVLQNNRNEIFSFTYVDDEQFKPYTMQIDRINKIEKELLEEGE